MLNRIILYLIQLIEKWEYRKSDLNQTDDLKKITNILSVSNLKVETDYGFVPIEEINITQPYNIYHVELENGLVLDCADTHVLYNKNHQEIFVNQLKLGDELYTKLGDSKIIKIKKLKSKISMMDLSVDAPFLSYYTNNILSHNTVSAAIVLLWFVHFENDKNVMIVANKGKTTKEIIRKIKDIYKLLPFYLKKGVINWNESTIAFDNGSRIQTENRTADPSVGFSIDLLYLDEFAKVPNNIIEPYFGAVVPTVSSINNSKIIITSTPEGYNLFHTILIDAERDEDDPLKNMFNAMRVYWWQTKGRLDVKIFPVGYKTKKYNITRDNIKDFLIESGYNIYEVEENGKKWIKIKYNELTAKPTIDEVRLLRIKLKDSETVIPLVEMCLITNWKEEQIKLLANKGDLFEQEFDLQFISGNKLLFDSMQMERFRKDSTEFTYIPFDKLDKKIMLPYNNLKWINNLDLFNPALMKDYHICASIDLGEGLGQDYSVLNIFRLMPKSKEEIEETHDKLNNAYDYFKLVQIGLFRVNNWSISEFAELFYMVIFELFDSDKCKVVLEYNTYGGTLLSELPHIFNDKNNFSNSVFLRYKHAKDSKDVKIGIKITKGENDSSKKILVKSFQDIVKKNLLIIHNDITINEISTFVKKETPSGDFTYKNDAGHDDVIFSVVTLSSIFSHVQYKNLIEDLLGKLPVDIKNLIDKYAYSKVDNVVDYTAVKGKYSQVYKNKNPYRNLGNPFTQNIWK